MGTSANVGLRSYWPGPGIRLFSYFNFSSFPNVTFPFGPLPLELYDPGPGTLLLSNPSLELLPKEYLPFPLIHD